MIKYSKYMVSVKPEGTWLERYARITRRTVTGVVLLAIMEFRHRHEAELKKKEQLENRRTTTGQ